MDEYLNYLNTIKNFQHVENRSYHSNYQSHTNENRDSYHNKEKRGYQSQRNNDNYLKKKRNPYKEYKDLDEIETQQSKSNNASDRNLISYDDL